MKYPFNIINFLSIKTDKPKQMIMKSNKLSQEQSVQVFSNMISNKVHNGFTLEERNDELLFAVLSKGGKVVNHSLNFMIFCLTLGLWSFAWLYLTFEASKQKKVLVAIDEDGFPFEEKCLVA
ncbi:hypothetical protein SAMN05444146_4046 [Flavobacterium johnsoniae]|uniref:hypothetical protein n=1 Tax=Flavobacterium sp. 22659 TaxID=3453953 RepID=UPI000920BC4C|nr:hypothetical protein SAMN05444146_4046 [Flavobacterium johnsoniae]